MKLSLSLGAIVLSFTAFVNATPHLHKRQSAQVFYECTKPNTVAITFVSVIIRIRLTLQG